MATSGSDDLLRALATPLESSDVVADTFDVGGPADRTAGDGVSHFSASVGPLEGDGAGPPEDEAPSSAAQLSEEQVRQLGAVPLLSRKCRHPLTVFALPTLPPTPCECRSSALPPLHY